MDMAVYEDGLTMDKPILPKNPTHEQIINWERELWAWEQLQIERLEKARPSREACEAWKEKCKSMGHTIDRLGRRIIFRVTNSRGAKRHFNSSHEAIKFGREAINQPTHITILLILPEYSYWATPLTELVKLIKENLTE